MTESEKINRILDVVAQDIAPLTKKGVTLGNKVFGAAILNKKDLSLVLAETNNETENPLWHGEVHCLKRFYEMDPAKRPDTKDCIFIATHEPCSLCLSAITWTGFDNFWYLFSYTSTKDAFNIPHDLKILDEVFAVKNGNYRRFSPDFSRMAVARKSRSFPQRDLAEEEAQSIRVIGECSIPQRK
jgi:tRNA(Arg) A34 adenosine deaminase TadA